MLSFFTGTTLRIQSGNFHSKNDAKGFSICMQLSINKKNTWQVSSVLEARSTKQRCANIAHRNEEQDAISDCMQTRWYIKIVWQAVLQNTFHKTTRLTSI